MTRRVWAVLAIGALYATGCNSSRYYETPEEHIPPPANINGTTVQVIDQRPDWEKKPFIGVVCLYHLGKAHPDAWTQLSETTNAVVAAMPQKPERVEVAVTSFRLVKSGDTGQRYRDLSAGPNPNPALRTQDMVNANRESHQRRVAEANGTAPNDSAPSNSSPQVSEDRPGNTIELMFAAKDDPRRILRAHPLGASCELQAKVRLIYPGGQEQIVDVETMATGTHEPKSAYYGEAIDDAAKKALFQYGRQFRSGVGLKVDE